MVLLADLPTEDKAGHVREHHIQHSQIQALRPDAGQRLRGCAAGKDGESLAFEIDPYQVRDLRLVVHHQDIGLHISHLFPDIISTGAQASQRLLRKDKKIIRF